MEERNTTRATSNGNLVLGFVIPYIKESRDRDAVSTVCKSSYETDRTTRKHITMDLCYTARPEQLSKRFTQLESIKLKGKPRTAMFNMIPEDWGGYVTPWVVEITKSFSRMKSLHFRRMIVKDSDLELLASKHCKVLEVLKLDNCSGFSTDGLLRICRSCSKLRTLVLEESYIVEKDGNWVTEVAQNNTVLENLNFYMTGLVQVRAEDLELIARNCKSLVSMKISECKIENLVGFFRAAVALEEFGGGSFSEPPEPVERYAAIFPPRLCQLGLTSLGIDEMPILFPISSRLRKLDLLYALLSTEAHCLLLQECPNLEILEARNVLGGEGLEVLGKYCKKLRRLRIERGYEEGAVTHRGLIDLAKGCRELEYMAVCVSDITNEALANIGTYTKNLCDFRLVLLDREGTITDLPLDNGVRALLIGCHKLKRFALCVRRGGLSDIGLGYVGEYSPNVRWMLLGDVGESDQGLLKFSEGCPNLQKLEVRGCRFSDHALASAAKKLQALRYLWVQYSRSSTATGQGLSEMDPEFWNIELIPARSVISSDGNTVSDHPAHMLAYCSLAGQRTDFPDTVRPLDPNFLLAE